MMGSIHKVVILGSGVLGSQIAMQTAYHGFDVVAYDVSAEMQQAAVQRFDRLVQCYAQDLGDPPKAERARKSIHLSTDLAEAVVNADLVIEAIPEDLNLKREVYTQLGKVAPEKTIFATNSSSLLPSDIAPFTGRPEKFLALHFANMIWKRNTAEIMGHPGTDPNVFAAIVQFAKDIGMVPITLHKEKSGYILNSLVIPFLRAGILLVVDGYADPEMVDKAWKIGTGTPMGPLEICDVIGLRTVYHVTSIGNSDDKRIAVYLKEHYLDKGKFGVESGEGFYKYSS